MPGFGLEGEALMTGEDGADFGEEVDNTNFERSTSNVQLRMPGFELEGETLMAGEDGADFGEEVQEEELFIGGA
jgi:hypothetical protein